MQDTLRFENGGSIPVIGLGTWKSEPGEIGAAIREALVAGYRHVDCARIYLNEAEARGTREKDDQDMKFKSDLQKELLCTGQTFRVNIF